MGGERLHVSSRLLGRFNLSNILAAAAAAFALDIPGRSIRDGIAALIHVPGRLEKVSTAGQPAVFVDYAHTDDALRRVLQNLSAFRTGKIITVFGCGGDRDRGKRPLMGEAASALSDLAIVTSDNPRTEDPLAIIREIETGIRTTRFADAGDWLSHPGERGYLVIPDRKEAIAAAIGLAESERHRPDRREGSRGLPDHRHTEVPLRRPADRPGRAGTLANREGRIMTDDAPVLSAGEILKATGGAPLRGGTEWTCRGISTDTRTLRAGNLFIALQGENFDGHDCLAAAAQKGAAGLLIRADELRESGQP